MIDLIDPGDLVFTVRNVERRRRVREMLRAKESAFEISQSALFSCNPDGTISNANRTFCEMFGLEDENDAKAHTFADFFVDDPLPENFAKALDGETTTVAIVAEGEDGEGTSEIEITLAPNKPARKIVGVVGSVIKVS